MKRVVIVSPYFPPSTLAGVHRARHLAKHLPAAGWQPIILCVHENYHEEKIDRDLESLLPPKIEMLKSEALPNSLMRALGVGDLGLRAFYHLKSSLRQILDNNNADAILITGSPFYPMLLTKWLKRRYGKPVILDFQDPWVSTYGKAQRRFSKGGLSHRLALHLEPLALRYADFITSVSEVQNAEMAANYPWLNATRMAAIPIGGDPDDYGALRTTSHCKRSMLLDAAFINFSYVGTFLPRSAPVANSLFSAIAEFRRRAPELSRRLRFNFIGTSNQTKDHTSFRFRPLAEAAGVADLVTEVPQRVPFLDALNTLVNSNVIVLLGSDEPHYTASKIYPGLMSGRPFLSIFHSSSSSHRILSEAGGGAAFSFDSPTGLARLSGKIATAIHDLVEKPDNFGRPQQAAIAPFSAASVARQFSDVFAAAGA